MSYNIIYTNARIFSVGQFLQAHTYIHSYNFDCFHATFSKAKAKAKVSGKLKLILLGEFVSQPRPCRWQYLRATYTK